MHSRIKTGVATLIQFIFGTALAFIGTIVSIVSGCKNGSTDCVSNAFVSLLLVILTVAAYGILLGVGYIAQDRRNPRLALALIGLEFVGSVIFLFDTRHATGFFDRSTNLLSFLIAAWVTFIAFRQFRARGRRMVHTPRRTALKD